MNPAGSFFASTSATGGGVPAEPMTFFHHLTGASLGTGGHGCPSCFASFFSFIGASMLIGNDM